MALLTERWEILQSGTDPSSGQPYAQISRKSGDYVSVWKLRKDRGEWRVESMFASNQTLKTFSERGLRLTASRIDTILHSFADGEGFPEGA
jgi:hypothetical protein